MKKYFFILFFFLLMIVTVSAKQIDEKKINVGNLNSNELLNFLKEFDSDSNAIKVCNQEYCDYLKYNSLEKSVNKYIDDYVYYVKEKTDVDTSVRVRLKGFIIKEIYFY